MKVEARIFDIVTVFAFIVAVVYGVMTGTMTRDGVEPVGLIALILSGTLSLLAGSYMRFIARRIDPRPEDREDGEISDGAGDLGFFSPGSYWPVGLAAAAAISGIALAFFEAWLLVIAFVLLMITIGGLIFEYHTAPGHE